MALTTNTWILDSAVMLLSKCTLFSPSLYLNPYHLHMPTRCFPRPVQHRRAFHAPCQNMHAIFTKQQLIAVAKCTQQTTLQYLQHFVSQVIYCQFSSQQCHYGGTVGDWLLLIFLLFIQPQAPWHDKSTPDVAEVT